MAAKTSFVCLSLTSMPWALAREAVAGGGDAGPATAVVPFISTGGTLCNIRQARLPPR